MHTEHLAVRTAVAVALAALALLGASCGDGGAPGYCSDVDDLEQSVKDLGSVDVVQGGTDAVTEAVDEVEDNARSAVDAAKSDFPDETSAISESIARLKTATAELTDAPTAEDAARAAGAVAAVVTAVDDFVGATGSECD